MDMETQRKFEGTEMADIMWSMVDKAPYENRVISGRVYWEDCLEFADRLHRAGYRLVAEPETNNVIKGEVVP